MPATHLLIEGEPYVLDAAPSTSSSLVRAAQAAFPPAHPCTSKLEALALTALHNASAAVLHEQAELATHLRTRSAALSTHLSQHSTLTRRLCEICDAACAHLHAVLSHARTNAATANASLAAHTKSRKELHTRLTRLQGERAAHWDAHAEALAALADAASRAQHLRRWNVRLSAAASALRFNATPSGYHAAQLDPEPDKMRARGSFREAIDGFHACDKMIRKVRAESDALEVAAQAQRLQVTEEGARGRAAVEAVGFWTTLADGVRRMGADEVRALVTGCVLQKRSEKRNTEVEGTQEEDMRLLPAVVVRRVVMYGSRWVALRELCRASLPGAGMVADGSGEARLIVGVQEAIEECEAVREELVRASVEKDEVIDHPALASSM